MAGSGSAGSLWVKLGVNSKSFDTGLKEAENKLKKMGDTFANIGQRLTIGLSLPLALISGAAIKLGMDAVESENLFSVSMGKMADSARKWSEDLRKNLGLNSYEVRQNVGTFNVMLTSMGLTEKAAFDMSKGLTQLAYDMASFYNLKPEEAFQKLQSGISGESEPLKRLGIIVNETTVKNWALNNGLIKQGEQLSETGKVAARYGTIMEATSKAQGDMARTLDSPANKMRILQSRIQQMAIDLGTALLPAFQSLMTAFQPLIQMVSNVAAWFNKLSPETQILAGYLIAITIAVGPLIQTLGVLYKTGAGLVGLFRIITTSGIVKAVQSLGTAFITMATGEATATTATVSLAAAFAPFLVGGAIIVGLMAIIGCFQTLQKYHNLANADITKMTDIAKLQEEEKYWNQELKKRKEALTKYSQGPNTGDKETDRLLREHNKLLGSGKLSNPQNEDVTKKQLEAAVKEAENKTKQIKRQQEKINSTKTPKVVAPEIVIPEISNVTVPVVKTEKPRTPADIIKEYGEALTEIKNKESAMTSLFDEPAAKADLLLSKIQELSAIDPSNKALKGWITDYKTITGDIETAKKLEEERQENEKKAKEQLEKQIEQRKEILELMDETTQAASLIGQPEWKKQEAESNKEYKKQLDEYQSALDSKAISQAEYDAAKISLDKVHNAEHTQIINDGFKTEVGKATEAINEQMQLDKGLTREQKKQIEERLKNKLAVMQENNQEGTPEYEATSNAYINIASENLASSDDFSTRWNAGLAEAKKSFSTWGDGIQGIASTIANGMSSLFETSFFDIWSGNLDDLESAFESFVNSITQSIAKMMANLASSQLTNWISSLTSSSGGNEWVSRTGARASGGSVYSDNPYIVGEAGPELFVPSSSGSIITNSQLAAMNQGAGSSGSGDVSVSLINNSGVQTTAKVTSKKTDSMGNQAITLVMEAVTKNTGGSRDFFKALGKA